MDTGHAAKADTLHAFYTELLGTAREPVWSFDPRALYEGAAMVDSAALEAPFQL